MLAVSLCDSKGEAVPTSRLPSWYGVHVRSCFEAQTSARLSPLFECCVPTYRQAHHWSDRRKVIEIPFFRGYVFVRLVDTPEARLAVLQTLGVVRILGLGNQIEPIPDGEMEAVRRVGSQPEAMPHPFLKCGAWVRVRCGPLTGMEGILSRMKKKHRLVVSIDMLSQSVAIDIDAADVEVLRVAA